MEKKIINLYSHSSDSTDLLIEEQFEQSMSNLTSLEGNQSDISIDDLFNRNKMEDRLEQYGYTIPKLFIARKPFFPYPGDEEFHLPMQHRDIYEETTYTEFQTILSHLQSTPHSSSELIHFKINFKAIWDGIR